MTIRSATSRKVGMRWQGCAPHCFQNITNWGVLILLCRLLISLEEAIVWIW